MALAKDRIFELIFLVFVVTHFLLFNINYAEWGDSYRILDAAESIKQFSYPEDEKRPPLFSAVLSLCTKDVYSFNCQRGIMFVFSLGSFIVFAYLASLLLSPLKAKWPLYLALILFTFNPVFLYWSLRVMADVPFTFFVLLTILCSLKWKTNLTGGKLSALGILSALAILTRYEGYLLFISISTGLLLKGFEQRTYSIDKIFSKLNTYLTANFKILAKYLIVTMILLLPFWIWRSPLESSYLKEPTSRTYDLKILLSFVASFVFVFGFTPAFFFFVKFSKDIKAEFEKYPEIITFVLLELILILSWPAAVPRLFAPLIPFLLIFLAYSIFKFFSKQTKLEYKDLALLVVVVIGYPAIQYLLRLQFLLVNKTSFVLVTLLGLFSVFIIVKPQFKSFVILATLATTLWATSMIWSHKDIYKTLVDASLFAKENIKDTIGYSKINGVSPWYLEKTGGMALVSIDNKFIKIDREKFRYLLTSEELYKNGDFDLTQLQNYETIKTFESEINGKSFKTSLIKLNK